MSLVRNEYQACEEVRREPCPKRAVWGWARACAPNPHAVGPAENRPSVRAQPRSPPEAFARPHVRHPAARSHTPAAILPRAGVREGNGAEGLLFGGLVAPYRRRPSASGESAGEPTARVHPSYTAACGLPPACPGVSASSCEVSKVPLPVAAEGSPCGSSPPTGCNPQVRGAGPCPPCRACRRRRVHINNSADRIGDRGSVAKAAALHQEPHSSHVEGRWRTPGCPERSTGSESRR